VIAETCPQYLLLDASKYKGNFDQTAPYVISLRCAIVKIMNHFGCHSSRIITSVGTDHCPFNLSQKAAGSTIQKDT